MNIYNGHFESDICNNGEHLCCMIITTKYITWMKYTDKRYNEVQDCQFAVLKSNSFNWISKTS